MSSNRIEIPYLCVFSSNTGKYRLEKLFTQLNALERVEAIEINKDDPFSFPAFLWTDSVYKKSQVKKMVTLMITACLIILKSWF